MRGVVTVLPDLPLDRGEAYRRNVINFASFGTIAKNSDDRVKSTRITKPGKDERGVSPQVPIFVRQPGLQLGENTRVVRRDNCLGHLELTPKYGLTLELPE